MTTERLAIIFGVLVTCGACGGSEPNPLVPHGDPLPQDIVASCELANRRCSRCHSVERILRAQITEPIEWTHYVHKMRLMPGSDIPPSEEPIIARCLVYRSSGAAGLAKLPHRRDREVCPRCDHRGADLRDGVRPKRDGGRAATAASTAARRRGARCRRRYDRATRSTRRIDPAGDHRPRDLAQLRRIGPARLSRDPASPRRSTDDVRGRDRRALSEARDGSRPTT